MPDFNQVTPPVAVTNPETQQTPAGAEYPRHVHKWAGTEVDAKGNVSPKLNDFLVVNSDEEKATALKDGWSLKPVTVEPKGAKTDPKAAKSAE